MKHLKSFESYFITEGDLPKVKPELLKPINFNNEVLVKTNQEILNQLNHIDLKLPFKPDVKNPNFLSSVSSWLKSKGLEPELRVRANRKTGDIDVNGGVHWVLPGKDGKESHVAVDLRKGYFGVDVDLPKGIDLGVGYNTDKKIIGANLRIPI